MGGGGDSSSDSSAVLGSLDPRKAFLFLSTANALGTSAERASIISLLASDTSEAIDLFLDTDTSQCLKISLRHNAGAAVSVACTNLVAEPSNTSTASAASVVFTKLVAGPLSEAAIPAAIRCDVLLGNSAGDSLYHSLKHVYAPMLKTEASAFKDANATAARLSELAQELAAGLGAAARRGAPGSLPWTRGYPDPEEVPAHATLTVADECALWTDLANSTNAPDGARSDGAAVAAALEPVAAAFAEQTFAQLGEEDALEAVDFTARDALTAAWMAETHDSPGPRGDPKFACSLKRMTRLLELVGAAVRAWAEKDTLRSEIWRVPYVEAERRLRSGLRLLVAWERVASDLTTVDFLGAGRDWEERDAFVDVDLRRLMDRLEEVQRILEAHEEMRRLLTPEEAGSLNLGGALAPFESSVGGLPLGEFSEPVWKAAVEQHGRLMEPAGKRVAQKLREVLGSALGPALASAVGAHGSRAGSGNTPIAQPHQVLKEVIRYGGLFSRPEVREEVKGELDLLRRELSKHLDNLRKDFNERAELRGRYQAQSGESGDGSHGRGLPSVVDAIAWAMQMESKVDRTRDANLAIIGHAHARRRSDETGGGTRINSKSSNVEPVKLSTSGDVDAFDVECVDVKRDIREFVKEQHEEWKSSTRERLDDIKLEKRGRLMDIDTNAGGQARPHYNDELVVLLREARQLQSMGFSIDPGVLREVETARKFYRHGMVLKQVAHFYNDVSTQMIACQKPMLISFAANFEKVLKSSKDSLGQVITWDKPQAVETYIQKVDEAAKLLTEKNRRLRDAHRQVASKVCGLFEIDLVRQRDRWGRAIKEIRDVFKSLEMEGFAADNQSAWRLHWDFQIYKALDYQYRRGLEVLNEALPQQDMKLVFKQKKLQYEPPLEEIRTKHYKEIRMFLSLPNLHKGVSEKSDQAGFFRAITDGKDVAFGIARVYEKAEALFSKLLDEQKKYADWVALGSVSLDDFVNERLDEVGDWEANFKALRAASKDAEKLPTEVRVDSFCVSLTSMKAAIDEQMRSLQDSLTGSLKRKGEAEKLEVEQFLNDARDMLQMKANSVEEIAEMRAKAKEIVEKRKRMQMLRKKVEEKNKLIRAMGGAVGGGSSGAKGIGPGGSTGAGGASATTVDINSLNSEWETLEAKLDQHEEHLDAQRSELKKQMGGRVNEFVGRLDTFVARWGELKPKGIPKNPELLVQKIEEDAARWEEMWEEAQKVIKECDSFGIDPPGFEMLAQVGEDIKATREAWGRYAEFNEMKKDIGSKDWITQRSKLFELEDFVADWSAKVRESKKADSTSGDPNSGAAVVATLVLEELEDYKSVLPLLKYARGDGWVEENWMNLFKIMNLPTRGEGAVTLETLTVDHFLKRAKVVVSKADELKHLQRTAQGESTIRDALMQLKKWGLEASFKLTHSESDVVQPVALVKEWKELMTEISDNQSLVGSLKESPFFEPFRAETLEWETRLAVLGEGLHHLNGVQRRHLYLAPIFARGALPQEQRRFREVDQRYRSIMSSVERNNSVKVFADIPRVVEDLEWMVNQLEVCQKALSDFLEEKRGLFPRFFFLGDDAMLEILGQAKNPKVIQTHLKKLFAGIHSVVFSDDNKTILKMKSVDGETVPLTPPVTISENVEDWLQRLSDTMQVTLRDALKQCLSVKDYRASPGQILGISDLVHFTAKAEHACVSGGLPGLLAELQNQLKEYTSFDSSEHRVLRLKIQGLIIDLIHNRDVVEYLLEQRCTKPADWAWYKQLRYYKTDESGACTVKMAECTTSYTNEYQGNAPKLVYTPLTDKCYLTLMMGMHLGYGGNPYGPAGTGKTESVKALAQALARQCLVFNCDEQFDYSSMARIFQGLCRCGAWGCFDEFNRLELAVLSAVSQQIQTIQSALKQRTASFEFMGKSVPLNPSAGIFVTLNPVGKGYGGRAILPDNLKALFRAIAMSAPDNALIAEVMLLSEGFLDAKLLGKRVVSLFSLSKQLLSPQQFYDWGLRALKTVLGIAGKMLVTQSKGKGGVSKDVEHQILINAMKVTTLPKLDTADTKRFMDLIRDVFPGVDAPDVPDEDLKAAIQKAFGEMGLQPNEMQTEKILQLHTACMQRIGVIIVGPSGSGKSTLLQVLEKAYTFLPNSHVNGSVVIHKMNPKAMNRQQLLGVMDNDTREWNDGVLTAAARQVVREPLGQRSWVLIDGDVDPEWIESLNSVLDDNRLLTIPTGERIQFGPDVNFIFETHSLEFASPATISRNGMIFLSEDCVKPEFLHNRWLSQNIPDDVRGQVATMVADYFDKAFVAAESVEFKPFAVDTTAAGLILNTLTQLTPVPGASSAAQDSPSQKRAFLRGLAMGFGGCMEPAKRAAFVQFVERLGGETNLLADVSGGGGGSGGMLSRGNSGMSGMSDNYDDGEDSAGSAPAASASQASVVETDQLCRDESVVLKWLRLGEPVLLVGPDGCGKTTLMRRCLGRMTGYGVAVMNCSAQTAAVHVVQKLRQMCGQPASTASGRVLRPKETERLVLWLKDINLAKPDKYATSQLVALLQQLVTHRGFHDDSLEFIGLERIQVVCTMTPSTTVGRFPLSTRFAAACRVFTMGMPKPEDLSKVYTAMVQEAMSGLSLPANNALGSSAGASRLATSLLRVFDELKKAFDADDRRHYAFTPRDITTVIMNLRRYRLEDGSVDAMDAVYSEACRVFRDRLCTAEERNTFDSIISGELRGSFRWSGGAMAPDIKDRPFFTTAGLQPDERAATETRDGGCRLDSPGPPLAQVKGVDFKKMVKEKMKQYSREYKELGLVLFPDAVEAVANLDRTLSMAGGSTLLCGRSGVGRRSAALLAAYMNRMEVVQPTIGRGYNMKGFRADLRIALLKAGVEGVRTMLLLEDHAMRDPAFLEIINSVLSGGEVPGIFAPAELEKELAPLRESIDEQGNGLYRSLYAFFVARIVANLHIVLCMDPSNEEFETRCLSNPALFTSCHIVWRETWSEQGMQEVPQTILQSVFDASDEDDDDLIVDQLSQLHTSQLSADAFSTGASPRMFVSFVHLYKKIFSMEREKVIKKRSHLSKGLAKLGEAESKVDSLSREANEQRQLLEVKQKEAEEALTQITAAMGAASERKTEVEQLSRSLVEEEKIIAVRKGSVEEELSDVQPLLEQARAAVGQIKSDNLNEIKSLKMPPDAIRDVLEGTLLLMGQHDTSWGSMRKFLSQRSIKEDIINFDARRVNVADRQNVEKLLNTKGNSFEHATIYRVSVAAAPLAAWVKANVKFSQVCEKIAPLENELTDLKLKMESSKRRLKECEEELKMLDQKVVELKTEFGRKTGEAEALKIGLQKAVDQLAAAESLIGKLSGEKQRWSETSLSLGAMLKELPLNAILAAGFGVYLSDETEDVRSSTLKQWAEIINYHKFDIRRFLSSESEMLEWKAEGLPGDELTFENAIVILNGVQVPLVIDPATHASEWLKKHVQASSGGQFDTVALNDDRFANALELAVRFGKTLVVTECDYIEPMLYPLLRNDLEKQGPRLSVKLGEKTLDYNENFKLYLITRNPTPTLPPDAISLVCVTNFTTTRSGLEGQLLGDVIRHEQPELEQQKSELLQKEESLKLSLNKLEESLLQTLADSTGNLLENKELIQSLEDTKSQSVGIANALEEGVKLGASLDQQRDAYRPLARKGSLLFFLLRDLRAANHMYRFSLKSFQRLFAKALSAESPSAAVEARVSMLASTLLSLVLEYVGRSLFNRDRLVFIMHVARHMAPEAFPEAEFNALLGSAGAAGDEGTSGVPSWITSSDGAAGYRRLSATHPRLMTELGLAGGGESAWASWYRSSDPEAKFADTGKKLSVSQQMLVLKELRPDRLTAAMPAAAATALALRSVNTPPFSLGKLMRDDARNDEPILFLITPGSDPSQELADFAEREGNKERYHELALGQGQSEHALNLLRQCARSGDWLVLKNVHLQVAWLPTLEKEVFALEKHESFRLFLTAEPHAAFPTSLLENSLIITYEAPPGLKKNMESTLDQWTANYFGESTPLRAQLLFMLAYLHAVLQERRAYIPEGWSKFYEFSFADLRCATAIVDLGTSHGQQPSWAFLHGLLGDTVYGGRVDNVYDDRTLRCYLRRFFSPEVASAMGGRATPIPGSRNMVLPSSKAIHEYAKLVAQMSDTDRPDLFFLPMNVDVSARQQDGSRVVTTLRALDVASVSASGFDRALWSKKLAPVLSLWESLKAHTGSLKGGVDIQASYLKAVEKVAGETDASPVDGFVTLERQTGLGIALAVETSLSRLSRILRGVDVLTPLAMVEGSTLLRNEVPDAWDRAWSTGPERPMEFLQDVSARLDGIDVWYSHSQSRRLLEQSLQLSSLFRPHVFLNALRQQAARSQGVSMDALKLATQWVASGGGGGADSGAALVTGLLVQGAMFDGSRLSPVNADSPTTSQTVNCVFKWRPSEEVDAQIKQGGFVALPLYETRDRTTVLAELLVPCSSSDVETWMLSGASFFTN